jgi:LPS O-antigen subunit length determinant protein (WzzB/FepE family)
MLHVLPYKQRVLVQQRIDADELADQKVKSTTAALKIADKLLVDKPDFISLDERIGEHYETDTTTT